MKSAPITLAKLTSKRTWKIILSWVLTIAVVIGVVCGVVAVVKAIDLQSEYEKVQRANGKDSANYPMTVIVVRKQLAEQSPEVVRGLLASFQKAVDWTLANAAEAGKLVEQHTLGLQAPIATKVVPNGAYVFVPAKEAQSQLEELYSIFLDFAPEAIGGQLPGNNFYFE